MDWNNGPTQGRHDGDTVIDGYECLAGSDPNNPASRPRLGPDTDGDGLTDAMEAVLGTDPNVQDTDHDGITDPMEAEGWGTSPTSPDSDADSCPDNIEIADINGDN